MPETTARANAGNGRVVERPAAAELAVLHCLATGLSRREIGAKLYISLNTVKTHTRELYRKLGASSRTDAVAQAEALVSAIVRSFASRYPSRWTASA